MKRAATVTPSTGRTRFYYVVAAYAAVHVLWLIPLYVDFFMHPLDIHPLYQWLVVSGAKAQYKGSGTVNGTGDYGFLLTATDGQITNGGGVDKFRIKIWDQDNGDAIVYDNKTGSLDTSNDATVLGGGSIVIHK